MRPNERQLAFRSGSAHRFTERGMEVLQAGKRSSSHGGLRNPWRMFKRRPYYCDELLERSLIQFGDGVFLFFAAHSVAAADVCPSRSLSSTLRLIKINLHIFRCATRGDDVQLSIAI